MQTVGVISKPGSRNLKKKKTIIFTFFLLHEIRLIWNPKLSSSSVQKSPSHIRLKKFVYPFI